MADIVFFTPAYYSLDSGMAKQFPFPLSRHINIKTGTIGYQHINIFKYSSLILFKIQYIRSVNYSPISSNFISDCRAPQGMNYIICLNIQILQPVFFITFNNPVLYRFIFTVVKSNFSKVNRNIYPLFFLHCPYIMVRMSMCYKDKIKIIYPI